MFTKKEKEFLKELLYSSDRCLCALDYNYSEGDEKRFKEEHRLSFEEANKLMDNIIEKINK